MAKEMADSIHKEVFHTLKQSRLIQRPDIVSLVKREDIVRVDRILGAGAFSQVSSVVTRDGRKYAYKHLKRELMEHPENFRMAAAELAVEAHMLASFDHPNILKVRGWAENGVASFEDGNYDSFFLLLDQLDETLDNRIDRWLSEEKQAASALLAQKLTGKSLNALDLLQPMAHQPLLTGDQQHLIEMQYQSRYLEKLGIMQEIATALEYVHERGVIFRDLKPNNIGFIGNRVQLFDFGLSRELPMLDVSLPFEMSGKVGTLRYMAPEVALHQPYNISADVYSWAMVAFEVFSLQKPFDGWTRDMHATLVCAGGMRPDTANCIQMIPMEMRILLEHAWQMIPHQRPSMSQLIAECHTMKDKQMVMMNEQEMQHQISKQIEVQLSIQLEAERQQAQNEVAAAAIATAAMVLDMSACFSASNLHPPQKVFRNNSIGTIETASLSSDSMDF